MSILDRLATSLGERSEVPNQELARELATLLREVIPKQKSHSVV